MPGKWSNKQATESKTRNMAAGAFTISFFHLFLSINIYKYIYIYLKKKQPFFLLFLRCVFFFFLTPLGKNVVLCWRWKSFFLVFFVVFFLQCCRIVLFFLGVDFFFREITAVDPRTGDDNRVLCFIKKRNTKRVIFFFKTKFQSKKPKKTKK